MQYVENVMSPRPRGSHIKSDDKWTNISNKQVKCVDTEPKLNIEQNEKRRKLDEIEWNRGI